MIFDYFGYTRIEQFGFNLYMVVYTGVSGMEF